MQSFKNTHRIDDGNHYWTCNWDCNWCYCDRPIIMPVPSLHLNLFTCFVPVLCLPRMCGVCVEHTLNKFALSSVYLLFLIVFWKLADDWEEAAIYAGGKLLICLISQAKIWAVQQNIISCVSFSSTPGCSHGNAFLLCESQTDQCGPFLIWTWKRGRWKR